jgi:tetratricopeptide (TPR) repeat protein
MADNPRIEELRRRVLADPASIAFAALAEEYRRTGNYTEAIETCRIGLQRHPSYISARVTLGRALIEIAEYEEARKELELVLKSAPENLAAIRGLAEIHERQRSLPEPDFVKPAPVTESPLPPSPPTAAAPLISVAEKAPAEAAVAEMPAPELRAVRVPAPIAISTPEPVVTPDPVVAPDPVIEDLEQFLVAIQSARSSSISR